MLHRERGQSRFEGLSSAMESENDGGSGLAVTKGSTVFSGANGSSFIYLNHTASDRHGNLPQRVSPAAEQTIDSRIGQTALGIVRRSHSADETAQRTKLSKDQQWDFDQQIRAIEEKGLQDWLIHHSEVWMSETEFTKNWEAQGSIEGAEHQIYFGTDGFVYKRNNLSYHTTWLQYLDRVAMHNWLFPETKMELMGFMAVLGELQPVIRQRIFSGVRGATRVEVAAEMALLGFTPLKNDDYINEQVGLLVEDLHDENVLIQDGGDLIIFDPVVYLNVDY